MAKSKRERIAPGERLRNTMVQAFGLLRPFEKEFRESLHHIVDNGIRLAELTAGLQHILGLIKQIGGDIASLPELQSLEQMIAEAIRISADTGTVAEAMETALDRQTEAVTKVNVAAMKLKELENDPQEIAELMTDAALLATNWKFIVHSDDEVLADTLTGVLPTTRKKAAARLSTEEQEGWINDLLEARSTKPIDAQVNQ